MQVFFLQFVHEKDAVVGQADLAGHGEGAAATQGDGRDGVVRTAEGAHSHQCGALRQLAGHAVDFGRFEGFAQGEGRHDGRQALGHHRFARARTAHQQDVVTAGTSDLKGALDVLLAFDLGEVIGEDALCLGKLGAGIHHGGFQADVAVEELHHLREIVHAVDVEVVDHSGLQRIGARQDETVQLEFAGQDGHGQRTLDGAQAAVQRQFAHEHVTVEPLGRDFLVGSQDTYGQRQVIGRPFLLDVGGRHIHHHFLAGELVSPLLDGATHALGTLLDGRVGQADDHESRPPIDRHLDFNPDGVDAVHRRCNRPC